MQHPLKQLEWQRRYSFAYVPSFPGVLRRGDKVSDVLNRVVLVARD